MLVNLDPLPWQAWAPAIPVLATDLWVFRDSQARAEQRRPVTLSIGNLELATPWAWLLGCLLLWVVVFPLHLRARAEP
jgi:hypothetical protein